MLPFVMLPRPLQESNVIGKGGTAGFLGAAYDPYYMFQDPATQIQHGRPVATRGIDQAPDGTPGQHAATRSIAQMPEIEKAVSEYALDTYDQKALELVISGRARKAFNLDEEKPELRDKYGRHTFGQSLLLARRLIEAGTRVVQVNWPAVANGNPTVDAWDTHAANFGPLKNLHCPKLDSALPALLDRHGLARAAQGHDRPGHRRIRPQPQDGRLDPRQHQQRRRPRPLAILLHRPDGRRRHPARRRLRQERQDRLQPRRQPGPPDRTSGHRLSRDGHQPGDDGEQRSGPASRIGPGAAGDRAVRVSCGKMNHGDTEVRSKEHALGQRVQPRRHEATKKEKKK